MDKIEEFKKTLAGNGPSDARLEALIFLVHLVGDIHQPLHCATKNDRGGNDLGVLFLGQKGNHLNLHSVWDSNLVIANMSNLEPTDYANRLNATTTKSDRAAWQNGGPKEWANESHAVAVKYSYCDGMGAPLPPKGFPNLDELYLERCQPQVARQLQKGGLRLAKVLNEALAK